MASKPLKLSPFNEEIMQAYFPYLPQVEAWLRKEDKFSEDSSFAIFLNFYDSYPKVKHIIETPPWIFLLTKYQIYLDTGDAKLHQELINTLLEIDPERTSGLISYFPIKEPTRPLLKEYQHQLKQILQGKFS